MKKILLTCVIVAMAQVVLSQTDGLRLYTDIGLHPFRVQGDEITLRYVDESPSQDNLSSNTSLKKFPFSPALQLGAEYEIPQSIFFKLGIEGYFGQVKGMALAFGAGYSAGTKINVRPQLLLIWGGSKLSLGDIYQNDLFIEVNDTRFYSNRVSVKLANKYFVLQPKVDIAIPIQEYFELRVGLGVNLPLGKTSPHLRFVGKDQEDNPADASESIFANNVNIRHDGNIITESVIKYAFPTLSIGIGWKIGKQYIN